jgi:DnaD/phage-associated family protein
MQKGTGPVRGVGIMKTRKRMITAKIRESENFASLSLLERDLWHGIIVVADDQGRLKANPMWIKASIWPYDNIDSNKVQDALNILHNKGFIEIYIDMDKAYIQVINWWEYQKLNFAVPSEYPAPSGWTDRIHYHGPGRKIVQSHWKEGYGYSNRDSDSDRDITVYTPVYIEPIKSPLIDNDFAEVCKAYEQNIGVLTPMISEELQEYFDDIPKDLRTTWMLDAFKRSVEQGVRKWSYARTILQDWITKGKQDTKKVSIGSTNETPLQKHIRERRESAGHK